MKSFQILISLAFLSGSVIQAQTLKELQVMVDKIQREEKVALTALTEDRVLFRELTGLTTEPQAMPYPQMKVLIDSMQLNLDSLQQVRRNYASALTSIEPRANPDGKFKGEPEAASQVDALKKEFRAQFADILVWEQEISRFHGQFANLVKLYKIEALDYGQYTRQFTGRIQLCESKLANQGKAIGNLKAMMAKNKSTMSGTDLENLEAKIDELSSIYSTSETYLNRLRGFQDGFSTTIPDELIYIAPSVPMPPAVQAMQQDLAKLEENLQAFEMISEEP
jgi:hypothetical protein